MRWSQLKFPERIQTPKQFKRFVFIGRGGDSNYWYDPKDGRVWHESTCNGPSTWEYRVLERRVPAFIKAREALKRHPTVERLKEAIWQAFYHGELDLVVTAYAQIDGNDHPALLRTAEAIRRRLAVR